MGMLVHAGGEVVELSDFDRVVLPPETTTHKPPHPRFVAETVLELAEDHGLTVKKEEYCLRDDKYRPTEKEKAAGIEPHLVKDAQAFGYLTFQPTHGVQQKLWEPIIGWHCSHNKSLPFNIVMGDRVFCCDNTSLHASGDNAIGERRKQRPGAMNMLYGILDNFFYKYKQAVQDREKLYDYYQNTGICTMQFHDIICNLVRQDAFAANKVAPLIAQWDDKDTHPEHGQNSIWKAWNCCTEVAKTYKLNSLTSKHTKLDQTFQDIVGVEV